MVRHRLAAALPAALLSAAALSALPLTAGPALAAGGFPVTAVHVPGGAVLVTADSRTGTAFVGNGNDSRITAIRASGSLGASLHGPCCGEYGLADDAATGTVLAAGIDDDLYAIDEATHHAAVIDVAGPTGLGAPGAVAVDPVTGRVYATSVYDDVVTVADEVTHEVSARITLPDQPLQLAVDPLAHKVFLVGGSSVWIVDERTNRVTSTVALGRAADDVGIDQRAGLVYVTSQQDDTLTEISVRTGHVLGRVHVDAMPGSTLLSVSVDPVAHLVYVASYDAGAISVVDGCTLHVVARVHVGGSPLDVAASASTGKVYVVDGSSSVKVISPAR